MNFHISKKDFNKNLCHVFFLCFNFLILKLNQQVFYTLHTAGNFVKYKNLKFQTIKNIFKHFYF